MPTVTPQESSNYDSALTYPPGIFASPNSDGHYIGNDSDWNHAALRVQLNIPPAATITNAYITFTANKNLSTDTVRTNIHYQDADDPADFSADDYASFEARTRSATSVTWDFTTDWVDTNTYNTADITALIQALVNEAYWTQNDHCVLFVEDDGSDTGAYRRAHNYWTDPSSAPILTVDYSTAGGQPVSLRATTVPHLRQWHPRVAS